MALVEKFDTTDGKGRGFRLTEKVAAGTLVMSSVPFAYVLDMRNVVAACHCCLQSSDPTQLKSCSKCKFAKYCNEDCQKKAWNDHKMECAALAKISPKVPSEEVRLAARILFKQFQKLKDGADRDESEVFLKMSELEAHENVKLNPVETKDLDNKVKILKGFLTNTKLITKKKTVSDDELKTIYSQIKSNAFMLSDRSGLQVIGSGIYPSIALLNHNCAPNCCAIQNMNKVELRPLKDLEANEELLISYVDPISTSIERKTDLKEKYNFVCKCLDCAQRKNDSYYIAKFDHVTDEEAAKWAERSGDLMEQIYKAKETFNFAAMHQLSTTALAQLEKVFPDSNLHVLRLLQPLVDVACGMQDFETAENAGRRISKVYETLLPKCHPLKGLQLMRLGVVQWHLMKLDEAISSFNAAEAHLSLTHGMNHPTVFDLVNLRKQCDMEGQIPAEQLAQVREQAGFGPEKPEQIQKRFM